MQTPAMSLKIPKSVAKRIVARTLTGGDEIRNSSPPPQFIDSLPFNFFKSLQRHVVYSFPYKNSFRLVSDYSIWIFSGVSESWEMGKFRMSYKKLSKNRHIARWMKNSTCSGRAQVGSSEHVGKYIGRSQSLLSSAQSKDGNVNTFISS